MRIVLVTEVYLPVVNGVVHSVQLTKDALTRAGHEVQIIAPSPPRGLHRSDEAVYEVPAIPLPGQTGYQLALPQLSQADRLIERADIVHTHHPFTLGRWALRVAERTDTPFVFTYHTQYGNYLHYVPLGGAFLRTPLERSIADFAGRCTAVVAPTEAIAEALRVGGVTQPVHVVPHGIEVDRFAHGDRQFLRRQLSLGDEVPLILYAGRLAKEKNLEFLLDCVLGLADEAAHVVITGSGPEQSALETIVSQHRAGDRIHFLSGLPYAVMPDVYASASIFLTCSRSEVMPLTLLEAQAAGLPAVVTDSPGTASVVRDHHTGLVVRPTRTAVRTALRQLLHRPALRHRYAQAARRHAQLVFDIDPVTEQLLGVYRLIRQLAPVPA